MCVVTLRDKVPQCLSVVEVMRRGRLRWFGHVELKRGEGDWISACRNFEVAGSRGRGRLEMTWMTRVREDMRVLGLRSEMVASWGERQTRISAEITYKCGNNRQ